MQKILGYMRKAIDEYNMIEDGDKIAVALSGGKDSTTMLLGLKNLQRFYPKKFEIIGITINPGFEFFDSSNLKALCDKLYILPVVKNMTELEQLLFNDLRIDKTEFSKLKVFDILELSKLYHSTNVKLLYKYINRKIKNP